jgi:hypothetical protein
MLKVLTCVVSILREVALLIVRLPPSQPQASVVKGFMDEALFHVSVFHSIRDCLGCLPLDEIVGQPNKGPVGQLLSGHFIFL